MSIGTAVIGCGNFARAVHLPNLGRLPAYALRAVMDSNVEAAEGAAERFGAAYATTDFKRVLDDPGVTLVFICTPHNTHGALALQAARAGKHVLVEKPMALKLDDIRRLVRAVQEAGVVLTVGFNRRYAPLTRKARELLKGRTGPVMLNYRIVDQIWRHRWALDPEVGGGRILSEAVHILDFCAFIIGAEPKRVFAEGGALTHPDIPDTQDNAVITLKFEGGSVASIMIGDLGHAEYPKERAEVFAGERTVVLDNYQYLEARGFGDPIETTLPAVEKGFVEELEELARGIKESSEELATELDGARATLCAVKAIEAMRTGMPQDVNLASVV